MDYRVQPSNIVSVARPTGEEGYLGSSEQRNAVKATRVSQKPQGPARYGGSEGQRVASDSASLSLRTDSQTLWMARIETTLPSQHYYGSASEASSDGIDPPILAAALTGHCNSSQGRDKCLPIIEEV